MAAWLKTASDWASKPAGTFATGFNSERPHALRVNQLDARQLDLQITGIVKEQLTDVFALLRPDILDRFQPELEAGLQAILWRCSIYIDEPTPGGRLQNLMYAHAASRGAAKPKKMVRWQKLVFLMLYVIFPWFGVRLKGFCENIAASRHGRQVCVQKFCECYRRKLAPRLGSIYSVLTACNFLMFLRHGIYSTLEDRLMGVRMMHVNLMANRQTEFVHMNRVMLWAGLSEFLMVVTPLVNLERLQKSIWRRLFPKAAVENKVSNEPGRSCGLCAAAPVTLPMLSSCGHTFCYFCIASEIMENARKSCPVCSSTIQSFGPLQ